MDRESWVPYPHLRSVPVGDEPGLQTLFHRLNNQLGIILANAELLEAKLGDDASRSRARQIVASAADAIGTATDLRVHRLSSDR